MLSIRHHNSADYEALPDIDEPGVGLLADTDQNCLDQVGRVLLDARVGSRFALTLLHRHFPVGDDEILLERVDFDKRAITLQPVDTGLSDVFAINVCFQAASPDSAQLVGLEFASSETLAGVLPIDESDIAVLESVGRVLRSHRKEARFGIRLLHDPLDIRGAVLLETCDPEARVLTCRKEIPGYQDFIQSIPTVFRWEEAQSESGLATSPRCMQFCRTVQRCISSRSGHSSDRNHEPTGHESL